MQIFYPNALGNAADTTDTCQMMSCSHVEKDLNRNEHLNLKLEYNISLTAASPKI